MQNAAVHPPAPPFFSAAFAPCSIVPTCAGKARNQQGWCWIAGWRFFASVFFALRGSGRLQRRPGCGGKGLRASCRQRCAAWAMCAPGRCSTVSAWCGSVGWYALPKISCQTSSQNLLSAPHSGYLRQMTSTLGNVNGAPLDCTCVQQRRCVCVAARLIRLGQSAASGAA